ncbi:MAG: glutathione S-transferase family protein [Pseudomonadota bacterium]
MKLYDGGRAPNPRRVRIFLAEKGVSVPMVQVDIMALEQKAPEIAALNPMMRVPILEFDDGTVLSESVAICRYFEEVHPEPPLMGIDARDRATVEMWNRRMELNLGLAIAAVARHGNKAMAVLEPVQVPDWADLNRDLIPDLLALLNSELAGREFIAGPRYTIADITALSMLDFMKVTRIPIPEDHAHLLRWHEAVRGRPSARA